MSYNEIMYVFASYRANFAGQPLSQNDVTLIVFATYKKSDMFIVGVAVSSPDARITAQPVAPQLQVAQAASGVRITIEGAHAATWPTVAIGGLPITAQLGVVRDAHNMPAPSISSTLDCLPWAGTLRPNPRPIPQASGQTDIVAVVREAANHQV